MIKKYFAMTIIAASVSLAACSSDDDDDDNGTTPPVSTAVDGSAYDLIAASTDHATLLGLIDGAGLDTTLDGADATFTVFAPNDAAFTAYNDAVAAGLATTDDDTDDLTALADFSDAQVSRILLNHVVSGSVATPEDAAVLSTLAAADATVTPALVAQTLTVSIDAVGNTSVAAIGGDPVLVLATLVGEEADAVEQDIVHSVGAILVPSDLPADETTSGGGEPVTGAAAALIGDGTAYSEAGGAFLSTAGDGFPASLDNTDGNTDAFMFFVPSNAAMTAATLTGAELTGDDIKRHIATTVTDLAAVETVSTVGPEGEAAPTYAVAADADADVEGGFTVGGFPVTLLGETPEGGQIYGIEGILP